MAWDRIKSYRQGQPFDQAEKIAAQLLKEGKSPAEVLADPSLGGVCLSLALKWIKLKLGNRRETSEARMQKVNADVKGAIARQGYSRLLPEETVDGRTEIRARHVGVQRQNVEQVGGFDGDDVYESISDQTGEAMLMEYRWPDNAGHAVAFYVSRGLFGAHLIRCHVYFFDPNCGEYRLSLGQLRNFWDKYRDDIFDAFGSMPDRYQIANYRNALSPREQLEAKMGQRA